MKNIGMGRSIWKFLSPPVLFEKTLILRRPAGSPGQCQGDSAARPLKRCRAMFTVLHPLETVTA